MPRPRIEPFLLVIVDDDQHAFSVVGPMTDDTNWNNRVCDAQAKGRQVRCHAPGRSQTREQIIDYFQESGLKYNPDPGLLI
jgi:hypothetical protein